MCTKTTSLSFSRPKQTFRLSSKCPEPDEIKSMTEQGRLLFLWWPSLGHPYAARKEEAMWGQNTSTATATTNGLAQIILKWRICLSDLASRPFCPWAGHRQRGQMWCTLTRTAAHCVLRGTQIKGWEELSDTLKSFLSPSSSTKPYATIKPSHLAMFCPG